MLTYVAGQHMRNDRQDAEQVKVDPPQARAWR